MNYKKHHNRTRVIRKSFGNSLKAMGDWSRMLHLWWKRWLYDKKSQIDLWYIILGGIMNAKDRRLPKSCAKRFGHKSHTRIDDFIRRLAKTDFFERRLDIERNYLSKDDKVWYTMIMMKTS